MKYIVLSLVMILLYKNSYSQLDLKINELIVSNITVQLSENIIDEDIEDGPYLSMICVIKNTTDSLINIHPSESNFLISYNYKGEKYSFEIVALPFIDNDSIVLLPGKLVDLNLGINLLLGTPILIKNKCDYSVEMLEILPTLKLVYIEKNMIIKSSEINRVTVK